MDVLVVCLPTYNERENLEAMVSALAEVLPHDGRILVIDDNSPDRTGEIADRLAAEREDVDVLHRQRKEGLGPAYLDGFRHALALGADLVAEMTSRTTRTTSHGSSLQRRTPISCSAPDTWQVAGRGTGASCGG